MRFKRSTQGAAQCKNDAATRSTCVARGIVRGVRFAGLGLLAATLWTPIARAQCTTSLAGTVTAPNGDPLPNILVYVPTTAVQPFTVQGPGTCANPAASVSGNPLVSATTNYQGQFSLTNANLAGTQTIVIQAGKWRRQFTGVNVPACQTTILSAPLAMPASQSQGDMPRIAISTGEADALECVFNQNKMGISNTEFTAPGGGGSISLYAGASNPGASKVLTNGSVVTLPTDTTLVSDPATLNSYDLVMFACQGQVSANSSNATYGNNLVSYANTGGRVFATHYSYGWLDKANTFGSAAKWIGGTSTIVPTSSGNGVATINTSFTEGQILANWLHYVEPTTTLGQIPLDSVKQDQTGVVAPTQTWATLNQPLDGSAIGTPVMQLTFDTPLSASGVPQVVMSFTNTPATFGLGDQGDTIAISTSNSSATAADASLTLSLTVPTGVTVQSLTGSGSGTGWVCSAATLVCNRTAPLAGGTTDGVVMTVNVAQTAPVGQATVTGTLAGGGLSNSLQCGRVLFNEYHVETPVSSSGSSQFPAECDTTAMTAQEKFLEFSLYNLSNFIAPVTSDTIDILEAPVLAWATPAAISYGTKLSGTQLDATATDAITSLPIPGTFVYTPAAGTVEPVGTNTLSVTFTPTNTTSYATATISVPLVVKPISTTTVLALCIEGSTASPCPAVAGTSPPVITPLSEYFGQVFNGTLTETASDGSALSVTSTVTLYDLYNGVTTSLCTITVVAGQQCPASVGPNLPVGTHVLTAIYAGDATHASSTSNSVTINVLPDLTLVGLTSSANPALLGQAVTFTATATGNYVTPSTGTVTFYDGGTAMIGTGTLTGSNTTSFTTSSLGVGTHQITAVYGATTDFAGGTSSQLAQVISSPAPALTTAIALTSSLNPTPAGLSVTFTAQVTTPGPFTVIPTGSVTFLDGTTTLGTGTLNSVGIATFTTSSLKAGTHSMTATYAGVASVGGGPIKPPPIPVRGNARPRVIPTGSFTSGLAASVSPVLAQVITNPLEAQPTGFVISANPSPVTAAAGQYATIQVQVQTYSGFNQQVTLSCSGLPAMTTCVFQVPTIGATGGSTVLYVVPQGPESCASTPYQYYSNNRLPWVPLGAPLVAGLGLLALPRRRRRLRNLLAVVLMAGAAAMVGCGTCTNLGVQPGSYKFTLTGTPGTGAITTAQSVPITVNVVLP